MYLQKAWLKIRKLSLRSLAASVILGKQYDKTEGHVTNGINHNKKPVEEVLCDLLNQLSLHLANCEDFETQYNVSVQKNIM